MVEEMLGSCAQNEGNGSWLLYNAFIPLSYSLAILYPSLPSNFLLLMYLEKGLLGILSQHLSICMWVALA